MSTTPAPNRHRPAEVPPGAPEVPTAQAVDRPPLPVPLVALPAGHRACACCGQAVPVGVSPLVVSVHEVEGVVSLPPDPRTGQPRAVAQVDMETCGECTDREAQAVALLAPVGRDPDPLSIVRAGIVLDALAVLGQPVPGELTPAGLAALLRHLGAQDGPALRWVARFVGRPADRADMERCAPQPWAHVDDAARAALRSRFARYLMERRADGAPPVAVGPPAAPTDPAVPSESVEGGCVLCGLAAVTLPAAEVAARGGRERAASSLWRPLRAEPRALGGPYSPRPLAGHVCPSCADALDRVGAVGLRACERSLRAHLAATGRDDDLRLLGTEETTGLVSWGALAGRRPGTEPWEHVRIGVPDDGEEDS